MNQGCLAGLARAILRLTLPADWRDDILRDLQEDRRRRAAEGRGADGLWIWLQVVSFSLRFLPDRFREIFRASCWSSLDLRLALRSIRRHPGLALLTVAALSTGIAAATGAFALIQGAFFSDLPFPGGDRIYAVEDYNATRSYALWVGGEEYLRRREGISSFEYLGAYYSRNVDLAGEERVAARFVTPEILGMTEVSPLLGRLPDDRDAAPGAEPVVVVPHSLWISALGGDRDAVGSAITISGVRRTVIGVMPEGFGFPWGHEIWIPMDAASSTERLQMVGKLRPGVDVESARAEVALVARPDPRELQSPDDAVRHLVTPLNRPLTGGAQQLVLAAPLVALLLVLLVMATNVATVVLARQTTRARELAVRVALGSSRARVVGQLVLEVGITVVVAGTGGLTLAEWGLSAFETRFQLPFWVDFSLDPRVLAFTIGLAGLATMVAGVAPALRVTSGDLQGNLRDGGRGSSSVRFGRFTDTMIVVELAVSVGFLSAAAMLGQSLLSFGFASYGLPGTETLVAQVYFGWPDALRDPESGLSAEERARIREEFLTEATRKREEILDRALGLPGVRRTTVASRFPGDESETTRVEVEGGRPNAPTTAELAAIGRGYFDLLGVGVIQGRGFTAAERGEGAAVAVVDEPFVQAHLGGGIAVGRQLRFLSQNPGAPEGEGQLVPGPWLEIVGVVPDLGLAVGDPAKGGAVYRPLEPTNIAWVALRGEADPARWTPQLMEVVREIDPGVRIQGAQTLERLMMLPVTLYRALGFGFLLLGGMALLLSAASLHAVTACAVTRRTREFGIRRALGAGTGGLVGDLGRRAAVHLAVGTLVGAAMAIALLRVASILPWRLGPDNPLVLVIVPGLLFLAVLTALVGPLTRALSIRPAEALRHE